MKHLIEFQAFRDCEVDGVTLTSGQVVGLLDTELQLPAFKQALADGLIEAVANKKAPAPTEA